MVKTGLGTRIGNWDEASQTVVYPDTLETVVGGEDGLQTTTEKFKEYFATGNDQALNTYWSLLNSFSIAYRSPTAGGGNDGPNDPAVKRWIKTYHVGPIGPAKDDQEFFSAFEWNPTAGKGVLVDSEKYPHPYRASVDGENWAMTPASQRGNYSYLAFPGPGTGTTPGDYKAQVMAPSEAYWLTHPWKAAVWGDAQGNRPNRYVGVVAALDGVNKYAVSQRGYYHRTTLAAFNIVNGQVNLQATFDSADPQYWSLGGSAYDYQNRGNHFTTSADLDGDGWDEVVLKAMVLSLNAEKTKILPKVLNGDIMPTIEGQNSVPPVVGSFQFATDEVRNNPLNVWAPLRHGDRSALLPVDKDNNIREWSGMEEHLLDDLRTGVHTGWIPGPAGYDPMKGKRLNEQGEVIYENSLLWGVYQASDDEGSVAGNFSNRFPGAEAGSSAATREVRSMVTGEVLTITNTSRGIAQGTNAIWFGGGLTHMGVNGATIQSVNDQTFATSTYLATGLTSTGNKSTPTLKADMFGDWREELILRASGNRLGIVTTLAPTEYGIRTLMHDPMYRNGVANKNTGYDQVGFASFYLGDEAELPSQRTDIDVSYQGIVAGTPEISGTARVNEVLTADPGEWSANTALRYQWSADGAAIAGADKTTLIVTPALAGKQITVTVTGSKAGWADVSATSAAVGPVGQHPVWSRTTIYDSGERVSYNGRVFEAQWWTRGETPGSSAYGAWAEVGAPAYCGAEIVRAWTASWVYLGGELVVHNGHSWQAKWWTRNQAPGASQWGPWQDLGAC
jgi:chitodextrinase